MLHLLFSVFIPEESFAARVLCTTCIWLSLLSPVITNHSWITLYLAVQFCTCCCLDLLLSSPVFCLPYLLVLIPVIILLNKHLVDCKCPIVCFSCCFMYINTASKPVFFNKSQWFAVPAVSCNYSAMNNISLPYLLISLINFSNHLVSVPAFSCITCTTLM